MKLKVNEKLRVKLKAKVRVSETELHSVDFQLLRELLLSTSRDITLGKREVIEMYFLDIFFFNETLVLRIFWHLHVVNL